MGTVKTNLSLFKSEFNAMTVSLDERTRMAVAEMAAAVEQMSKEEIKGARGFHIGSQGGKVWDKAEPNKPPMNRTGNLRRSIKTVTAREGFGSYSAEIGPTMVYARRIEEGGGNWAKGLKFPYMQPAWIKFKKSGLMEQIMARYLKEL